MDEAGSFGDDPPRLSPRGEAGASGEAGGGIDSDVWERTSGGGCSPACGWPSSGRGWGGSGGVVSSYGATTNWPG